MQKLIKKVDVLVYTMGKVGSTSVAKSLDAADVSNLHIHFIAPDRITAMLDGFFKDNERKTIPGHIINSLHAYNVIQFAKSRVKVITLIRNPVFRNISAVFENMPAHFEGDADKILQRLQNYNSRIPDFWFEEDFIPVTGINVFQEDVDRREDIFRFANDKFDVLLLKLEAPDEVKENAIREFLGVDVTLARANEAKDKWYYDVYRDFRTDPVKIRSSFMTECLSLKYYNKFYEDDVG